MRILFFDMGSYTYRDVKSVMEGLGHEVDTLYYHFADRYKDDFFVNRFRYELDRFQYDIVFSVNFFPLIAIICRDKGIPYVSWSYDSPLDERMQNYFSYDTNHIFLFDRQEVTEYNLKGYDRVFHMPLAVNTDRIDRLNLSHVITRDVAFIGKIYSSDLSTLMYSAGDYIKGYVDALMQVQSELYGCNILERNISDDLIDTLNESYRRIGQDRLRLSRRGLAFAIATQITHFERSMLLNELADNHDVHIYTADKTELSNKVSVHGPVKYYDRMYEVFASSRLNLCPTLRSISSGIPLRALDILGSGSLLFSNYQPELAEYFQDGVSVVMYESIDDAIAKAEYYLAHPDECRTIAEAGREIAVKAFDYKDRIMTMLNGTDS